MLARVAHETFLSPASRCATRDQFHRQSLPKLLQILYFLLHPNWRIIWYNMVHETQSEMSEIPVRFDYMQLQISIGVQWIKWSLVQRLFNNSDRILSSSLLFTLHTQTRAIPNFMSRLSRRKNDCKRTSHCSYSVLRDARPQHDRLSYLLFISMT